MNKYIYCTLCRAVLVHGSPLSFTELPPLPTYARGPSQTERAPQAVGEWGFCFAFPEIVRRTLTTHASPQTALCQTEAWPHCVLRGSWVWVVATCGSLECHCSWKTPPETYQKPPPEKPKMYGNGQTAKKVNSVEAAVTAALFPDLTQAGRLHATSGASFSVANSPAWKMTPCN